jgi:GNAT superfamily N-acetyltransferase
VVFRTARRSDLPAIVALLSSEDGVTEAAEADPDEGYIRGFEAVEADDRNELLVVADGEGTVVACLQLTYIPGIAHHGAERALIEAVRVRAVLRGAGLGRDLMGHAIERARARGCTLVALTSNKRRAEAHRFYRSLGFIASHEGFRLQIDVALHKRRAEN